MKNVTYYENGKMKYEKWVKNGKRHRAGDMPACVEYYEDGQKKKRNIILMV